MTRSTPAGVDKWQLKFSLPGGIRPSCQEHFRSKGFKSMSKYLLSLINKDMHTGVDDPIQPSQNGSTPSPPSKEISLADAADTIYNYLQEPHRIGLIDQMNNSGEPLWRYFLSHLDLVHDRGDLSYLAGDKVYNGDSTPNFSTHITAHVSQHVGPTQLNTETNNCLWCQAEFVQTKRGQQFCPEPTVDGETSCSWLHSRKLMQEKRMTDMWGNTLEQKSSDTSSLDTQDFNKLVGGAKGGPPESSIVQHVETHEVERLQAQIANLQKNRVMENMPPQ